MEQIDPIQPKISPIEKPLLMTIRLLIISLAIYAVAFVMMTLNQRFDILFIIAIILPLIAIIFNVFGCIEGIKELEINVKNARIGIVGNLIPIVFFISFIVYQISNFDLPSQ